MNTRALAASALAQVTVEGQTLTVALQKILMQIPQENDRAFVQALCFGVMRWYHRLEFILARLAPRPIRDEHVRLLALLGIYQLEYTRVKPYAAVSETVAAADRRQWAKPLLNGILRSFQRQRGDLLSLADSHSTSLYSYPQWLVDRISRAWPNEASTILDRGNQPPPMTLRVNAQQTSRDDYLAQLRQAGLSAQEVACPECAVILTAPLPVDAIPGFNTGRVSVQDGAAQLAAVLLDLQPGQRILDVCAAPGGKTLHILEACPQAERVVAIDIAPERVLRIRQNLARAGLSATVVAGDAAMPASWWDGQPFDRILLDAPCSATGVIRRHPDIKLLRQPNDIDDGLLTQQKELLDAIWPLLAKGGLLIYATCSILKEENEIQIAAFLKRQPEARELPIQADWGRPVSHGRQILPGENDMDGFFYARLQK